MNDEDTAVTAFLGVVALGLAHAIFNERMAERLSMPTEPLTTL